MPVVNILQLQMNEQEDIEVKDNNFPEQYYSAEVSRLGDNNNTFNEGQRHSRISLFALKLNCKHLFPDSTIDSMLDEIKDLQLTVISDLTEAIVH